MSDLIVNAKDRFTHDLPQFQRGFEGEILSEQEEADLIHRLVKLVNHPSVAPTTKLLVIQWAQYYQQIQVSTS